MKRNGKYAVIIPALDPERAMVSVVKDCLEAGFGYVIVVNDGSMPQYEEVFSEAEKMGAYVLQHERNQGKGKALKTAFAFILDELQEIEGVITADADGQHKINDIISVGRELNCMDEALGIVLGCRRFVNTESMRIPFRSRFGNACTRIVMRVLCGINVSDTQTGLRGIPISCLKLMLEVEGVGYEYETNMLIRVANEGGKFREVPIDTIYENNNESSHFNPIKDSIRIYSTILKYSMSSLISAVVDNLVFILLMAFTENVWILVFGGRMVSMLVNYGLNRSFVFRKKGEGGHSFAKYIGLVIASGCSASILLTVVKTMIGRTSVWAKIVIEICMYFVNYHVQRRFVFR